jgi:hypothetical protein
MKREGAGPSVRPLSPPQRQGARAARRRGCDGLRDGRIQHRPIDRKMLGAQKPLHLRQADERRQKLLRDLVGEQAVAVPRKGRGVEHPLVNRKPDEPAKQRVALPPFDQPPLRTDRIEKPQKREAKLIEGAPTGWTGARSPRKARKSSRRAQTVPRWSTAESLAADGPPGCAPRRPCRRATPARPILAPHRSLAIRLPQSSGNYARATNTSGWSDIFFSNLLGKNQKLKAV